MRKTKCDWSFREWQEELVLNGSVEIFSKWFCECCLLNRQKNSTLALWSHLRNLCPNHERVAQKKITISLPRILDIGKGGGGGPASYPESSRKQDFKLISALISFALFSIYIQVQATVCLLCLFSFPCIYRSTFDSNNPYNNILISKNKIQLFSISTLPSCSIW